MGLTEKRVRDAGAGKKTNILWDHTIKGLGLRVTPAGAKSFVLSYRVARKKRLVTLARAGEISLSEVRELAGRELAAIRNDEADPLQRRQEARQEAREAPTVAELIEKFLTVEGPSRISRGRMSPNTLEVYGWQARKHLLPSLGSRRVSEVTRGDIELVVAGMGGVCRNRVLALTSGLFSLAERWEWRTQNNNPVRGIERAREEPRDRVLRPTELKALAVALTDLESDAPAAVAAIRVAALTGLRIGEVLGMKWEHVDFESGRLTLPVTKTGRRVHDLPTPALELLTGLPRFTAFCFTTGRSGITYKTVRGVFTRAGKVAGLDDVRLHDLRRTVMTSAAAAGVGTHILRDLLGHRTTQMADRYVRHAGNPVRDAREQVGAAMAAIMDGESAEVVTLRGRRDG